MDPGGVATSAHRALAPMIGRQDILDLAREFQLPPNTVEKDYALGWLLAGISRHPELRESWIFKGGTCLKKCYFETYRFSEDLDFTLREPAHLNEAFLQRVIGEVCAWIYETSGLELPEAARRFEVFENPRGSLSAQARVGYRGPLARTGEPPRIKFDLAHDELLVLEPAWRPVHHPYPDDPEDGIEVLCYAFEEVFAEKLRALTERLRPRDLYDVIHLHRRTDLLPDLPTLRDTLRRKCEFKRVDVPTFAALEVRPERIEIQAEWENMLAHQLPACPPFEQFWSALPAVFDWLTEPAAAPVALPQITAGEDVAEDFEPLPTMVSAWNYVAPLEAIRFAGSNRLLVDLGYGGRTRLIEPYSLRRTRAGDVVLYAVKQADGEVRSYRVDRIESATVTRQPFEPRFDVNLGWIAPAGSGSMTGVPFGRSPFSQNTRQPKRQSPPRTTPVRWPNPAAPKYVYKCAVCGKSFTRSKMDAKLNAHKAPNGFNCYGTLGMYQGRR